MTRSVEIFRKLFSGKWYPVFVAFLIFCGHVFQMEIPFAAVMTVTVVAGCWICNDIRFGISPLLFITFIVYATESTGQLDYSRYYGNGVVLYCGIAALTLMFVSLIAFMIRNRRIANRFSGKSIFWSLVILCAALLPNGAFNPLYQADNLSYVIVSMVTSFVFLYAVFFRFIRFDRETMEYLMFCLVVGGVLICAELLVCYLKGIPFGEGGEIVKENVRLGWGVWATVGAMIAFLLPAPFYFAVHHRHGWIGFLIGIFEYGFIFLSQGRAALLIGTGILAVCLGILCFYNGKNRKKNRLMTCVLILAGVAGVILLRDRVLSVLRNFAEYGFIDNGRFEKWEIGLRHLKEFPVFGSGFYDSFIDEEWKREMFPYFYHNIEIQFLASAGIVGFAAYLYHRFVTVKKVIRKPNLAKSFFGLCLLALILDAQLDVLFFKTYAMFFYAVILVFIDQSDEAEEYSRLLNANSRQK